MWHMWKIGSLLISRTQILAKWLSIRSGPQRWTFYNDVPVNRTWKAKNWSKIRSINLLENERCATDSYWSLRRQGKLYFIFTISYDLWNLRNFTLYAYVNDLLKPNSQVFKVHLFRSYSFQVYFLMTILNYFRIFYFYNLYNEFFAMNILDK